MTLAEPRPDDREARQPDPVDRYVGGQIKALRLAAGISMEKLGERVGITFQQVQKYESGTNRVSASRLFAICGAIGVRVEAVFPEPDAPLSAVADDFVADCRRADIELMKAALQLPEGQRRALRDFAKALASEAANATT